MDDDRLEGNNMEKRSKEFYEYFQKMAKHYQSNILQHTFGSDFEYTNALLWYKNLDKLIDFINSHPDLYNNMTLLYSTPHDYIEDLKD